jgi:hypothetical protein
MVIYASIRHDGKNWVVENDHFRVEGSTLDEIDEKVKNAVREKTPEANGQKVQVYMAYDNYAIPQWIRQYSSHYFDRVIEF